VVIVIGTLQGNGAYPYTAYFIDLTSQTWMSYNQSNRPVWKHWLTICVPPKVLNFDGSLINFKVIYETAFLFIDGGSDSDTPPNEVDDLVAPICGQYNAVVAVLNQIPDEPITFVPETKGRTEDALIAFTWAKFINDTSILK
jgi:PhoPQ-activated pathogenicity-related protein